MGAPSPAHSRANYIKNSQNLRVGRQPIQLKVAKYLNRHCQKDKRMANKYMKVVQCYHPLEKYKVKAL